MKTTRLVLLVAFAALAAVCWCAAPCLGVSLLPGWPRTTGFSVWSSAALGDLDGDGKVEVVVGSCDNKVYAWHGDGILAAGWPQSTSGIVDSSPALGDLDGNGKLEVVAGSTMTRCTPGTGTAPWWPAGLRVRATTW